MSKTDKYIKLMTLLISGFLGFVALLITLFFVLKLCSITLFHLPGFDRLFQFIVSIFPYLIFYVGYYYLYNQIRLSKNKIGVVIGIIVLTIGSLLCAATMVLATLTLFGVQKSFLLTYRDNSQYGWIIQVVLLFFMALFIASGDPKEQDWMDKNSQKAMPEEVLP